MPTIGTLTINDGQATPVAHNFDPSSGADGIATFRDDSASQVLEAGTITAKVAIPSAVNANSVARVTLKIKVPTLETDEVPPSLAYTTLANLGFVIPLRADLQDRKDILAYSANLLGHADIVDVVENLARFYG